MIGLILTISVKYTRDSRVSLVCLVWLEESLAVGFTMI
jgi:hypothetical protein